MTDSLDRSDTGRASTGWPAVLALLAAASASLAVCLYTLDHLKYRVIAAVVAHQALRPGRILTGLGPLDFLVAAFAAGAAETPPAAAPKPPPPARRPTPTDQVTPPDDPQSLS